MTLSQTLDHGYDATTVRTIAGDPIARNPVEGTSQLCRARAIPQALTLDQITAIREAAAKWRSEPGLPEPKPDGPVRDIIEVLLGTAMRPGEVLAPRAGYLSNAMILRSTVRRGAA